jgi:hypothetical protein
VYHELTDADLVFYNVFSLAFDISLTLYQTICKMAKDVVALNSVVRRVSSEFGWVYREEKTHKTLYQTATNAECS